jgi:hypothetical protein
MDMTKEEAQKKIEELLKQSIDCLIEAGKLGEEHDIYVSTDGPAWGMGGSYVPTSERGDHFEEMGDEETGWISSSAGC